MFTGWEFKLIIPVASIAVIAWEIAASFSDQINLVLNVAALVTIAGGLLVYGRMKARGDAAAGAAEAWRAERDAAAAKSERLENELRHEREIVSDLRIQIKELEQRPTLEQVEIQLERLTALMTRTAEAVQQTVEKAQSSTS